MSSKGRIVAAACAVAMPLGLTACGTGTRLIADNTIDAPVVRVGALADPANKYLGALVSATIAGLGYAQPASGIEYFDSYSDLAEALHDDKVDVAPVSVATMLEAEFAGSHVATSDPKLNAGLLQDKLGSKFEVRPVVEASIGYVAVSAAQVAKEKGASFTDVATAKQSLVVAGPEGCFAHSEHHEAAESDMVYSITCGAALVGGYNTIEFTTRLTPSDRASLDLLAAGFVDVAMVSNSDAALVGVDGGTDLVLMQDTSGVQPADNLTVVGRTEVLDRALTSRLDKLFAGITDDQVRRAVGKANAGASIENAAVCDAAVQGLAVKPTNC